MASRLRKLRQHFGIAAPRVAVYSAVPWYWRAAGVAAVLAFSALAGLWIYGRTAGIGGEEGTTLRAELSATQRSLRDAQAELDQLRAVTNAADSRLAIERSAQAKLAQQIRSLEQENARLREDLATFESLVSADARGRQGVVIQRFQVEPEVLPGEYRYRVLLFMQNARREREFQGRLELVVSLSDGGRSAIVRFPEPADAQSAAFRLGFKHFQRVEGTFRVSPQAKVDTVQVRVYEAGAGEPRVARSLKLG